MVAEGGNENQKKGGEGGAKEGDGLIVTPSVAMTLLGQTKWDEVL